MATSSNDPYGVISATPIQGVKAVTAAGTPERLVAVNTYVEWVEIHPRKSTTAANTGAVYLGFSGTATQNYRVLLAAGDPVVYKALPGKKLNLKDFWVDAATNADAVTYTAFN